MFIRKSSLILIINSLSESEIRVFGEFLNSPYYNQNRNIIKIYNFIINTEPLKRFELTREQLHDITFPGRKYNDENIKTIIYMLTRLCEKFLVTEDLIKDEYEFNRRLLGIFDRRSLDSQFTKHLNKVSKNNIDKSYIDLNSVTRQSEFEKTLIEFYTKRNNEKLMFEHEKKLSGTLIAAFMVDMFKQYNIFWRTGYLDNMKSDEFTSMMLEKIDLEKLFSEFAENDFYYNKLLLPYYEIYKILKNDNVIIDLEALKAGITNNEAITGNEKFILSTILVNTLYYKTLKGSGTFNRELFEAFKMMVQMYNFSGEKYLRFTVFSNVLRMGLQLGEYDWTERFINRYYNMLEPSIKENMLYYSNAYLAFSRGYFDKCLEHESKINYDTFQQRYYLRDLRLCSLYELGKYETALSLIDSYKHFIKKDTNYTAKMKQGYLLFLTFMNDLIRLRSGISRKNISDIREKLLNSHPMRKDWLMRKFQEF